MQRLEHFNTLIVGHLNINSIRSKFEMIAETITNFDIFLISVSKIDSTFPNMQFKINGYKLFKGGGGWGGGVEGLILYLNEKIPCKLLNNHPILPNAEIVCKLFLLGCYKLPTQSDLEFIASITKIVDFYL